MQLLAALCPHPAAARASGLPAVCSKSFQVRFQLARRRNCFSAALQPIQVRHCISLLRAAFSSGDCGIFDALNVGHSGAKKRRTQPSASPCCIHRRSLKHICVVNGGNMHVLGRWLRCSPFKGCCSMNDSSYSRIPWAASAMTMQSESDSIQKIDHS